jgi:hypothetical protein
LAGFEMVRGRIIGEIKDGTRPAKKFLEMG